MERTDGASFTPDGNYIAVMENEPLAVWQSGVQRGEAYSSIYFVRNLIVVLNSVAIV